MTANNFVSTSEAWTDEHSTALRHPERIRALHARGSCLDPLNPEGQGLIHLAVLSSQKIGEKPGSMTPFSMWYGPDSDAKLLMLLQLGANENLPNGDGLTARDLAFIGKHALAFDALAHADMTIKTKNGRAPQTIDEDIGNADEWARLQSLYEKIQLRRDGGGRTKTPPGYEGP